MMKKKLFLHIGTHKTGSTSLQRFLFDHPRQLRKCGISLYRGQHNERNHIELYLAAMRYERDAFAKQGVCKHVTFDADYTEQVAARVRKFIHAQAEPCVLLTTEGLSLLRHADEIERLRTILDSERTETTVILYLRNREDFLRSYKDQLQKEEGRKPSSDYWSALYVEPDTWLIDFETLTDRFRAGFGASNVKIIDYDAEMARTGNIIPSFLQALAIQDLSQFNLSSYFCNGRRREKAPTFVRRWRERLKQAWS